MKKYHVAAGDGKGYYGVGYESYRQAESLLKISQEHDPKAHIVEEEYHFTNGDRIRAMSDEELAKFLDDLAFARETPWSDPFARKYCDNCPTVRCMVNEYGREMEFNECDFVDGKCPHGDDVLWWLKEPYKKGETK